MTYVVTHFGHNDMEATEKQQLEFQNKIKEIKEEAVKCNNKNRCVLCDLCSYYSYIIRHWFGVTGSHELGATEKEKKAVSSQSNRAT